MSKKTEKKENVELELVDTPTEENTEIVEVTEEKKPDDCKKKLVTLGVIAGIAGVAALTIGRIFRRDRDDDLDDYDDEEDDEDEDDEDGPDGSND